MPQAPSRAIGYRNLSVVPSAVGPVKAMALELDAGKARALVDGLIERRDGAGSIRDELNAFAQAEGIPV